MAQIQSTGQDTGQPKFVQLTGFFILFLEANRNYIFFHRFLLVFSVLTVLWKLFSLKVLLLNSGEALQLGRRSRAPQMACLHGQIVLEGQTIEPKHFFSAKQLQ